jgi:VWFA-related protein
MDRKRLLSAVTFGMFSCCLAVGHAQQPEPSFRVSSELVVIDLVAVDRQGGFISDLRPAEIEVKEDGRRQTVQLLRLVGYTAPAPAAESSTPPDAPDTPSRTAPRSTTDRTGESVTRRLAIVVDALSLPVDGVPRVRESLLAAIADLPDDVLVLVATIGPDLQITQPFTTDKAVLRRAVSALPVQLDAPRGVSRVFGAVDRLCASAVDQRRVVEAAIEAGEELVIDAQARSAASSDALATVVDRLGAFEGRKHLVLYSSGHAMSPVTQAIDAVGAAVSACTGLDPMAVRRDASSVLGRLTNRAASEGLRDVIERANRSQTTFYTLDPSGITTSAIMPSTHGTAQTGGSGPLMAFAGLRQDAGRDYVEGLAAETGGLTVRSNDMAVVLRRAWEDASQYYLLGYPPPLANGKGDLRKIAVSVKRSGVSVRFRKGYIASLSATAAPPASDADRAIEEALASPARFADDGLVVRPTVQQDALSVEVLVPHAAITFSESSERYQADFAVHAVFRDAAQPATTTDIPGKDIALRLTPEQYARITAATNLRVILTTTAPKRDGRVTVVVRDAGGWIAAREAPCCASAPAAQPEGDP